MNCKNKFLSALLCLTLIFLALVGFVGCKNDADEDSEDVIVTPQEEQLEFSINNKELVIYSTFQLHVNKSEGVTFESGDENVATVDDNGLVYASGFGETTITAKTGDLQAQCAITVVGQNIIPSIQVAQDNISLVWSTSKQVGSSFDIDPQIVFNGATFTDGEFIYASSDPAVVSVSEDGQISAKGFGNAVVSVRGSWRSGFDSSLLNTNISVTVMPDVNIELIPESTVISTVNKTIDGTSYSNRTPFTARVLVDGVDYDTSITYIVDENEIDFSSTVEGDDNVVSWFGNSDVDAAVTIRGNEIVANKAGEASIVAKCVVEGIEIFSMPIVIEVVAPTVQGNTERAVYNVKADPTYAFEAIEGDFLSLSINGKTYNDYVDVDTLRLDMSEFYESVLGDNVIEIATTKYNYQYQVKFVTHIITDGTEFVNCITNDKGSTIYAILANDINFSVGEFKASSTSFSGVFDGQGYTIDATDTKIASEYGIFGRLSGELKNFALINATVFGKESTVLGERTYEGGAVKNVYVQAKYEENTQKDYTELDANGTQYYCGLFFRGFRFENVIVNIEYPTGVEGYALCGHTNVILVKNVYCVGNALQLAKTNSGICYSDVTTMLSTNLASLTYKNGFSEFWYFSDKMFKFGALRVADPRVEEKITANGSIVLDLEQLAEDEIIELYVDGTAIEMPASDQLTLGIYEYSPNVEHVLAIHTDTGIIWQPFMFEMTEEEKSTVLYAKDSIVLNCSDYDDATNALLNGKVFQAKNGQIVIDATTLIVGAEYELYLYNNSKAIKQSVLKVTHIISTLEELKAYLPNTTERSATTAGTYAVLTADIDFNGEAYSAGGTGTGYGYNGHFNGLGHAIKNVNIEHHAGFFGALWKDVVIENTQFINLTYSGTNTAGGLICATTGRAGNGETSRIDNVYIQGTISTQGAYNGIMCSGDSRTSSNKLIITNSIIDVQYSDPAEKSYVFGNGESDVRLTNVYVVSNATQYTDKDTTVPYVAATDLLTATTEDVATWGGYWKVVDGEIYFNDNKVVAKSL